MNTLSWLLYLADVAEKASTAFTLASIGLIIFGTMGVVFCWLLVSDRDMRKGAACFLTAVWLIASLFATTGAVLIPSKDTIYLIAASEAGEVVVKSDEAKEIMTGLRDIIKDQISKNLPKTAKD
ncbi:hypothetical protein [Ochrobactrum sp. MC-1LL]|uniref:hypothetical protein n=1 Tax=Ochrobactrum sp. MC-1LL TaxID=2735351 RepID=UPI000E5C493D|nr:hypothetical protein [Ochrobactrum sp. MC-1LL]NKE77824.1 hypothetical protein [Ochrobactrum sp. MC-1LL]